ncbi:MAG: hypothetical protein LBL01_00855 [Bifidobacteriaceae bacterium]|nr:hypothetical protein [Bifidobacteriaceae bacterium]
MAGTRTREGGAAAGRRNGAAGTWWARAAVELLIGGARGRLAYQGAPWIEWLGAGADGRPYARIDPEKLAGNLGGMSSGERVIAKVVANLIDDQTPVALADIARLDADQAALVLGALRIAAGLQPAASSRPGPAMAPVSAFGRTPGSPGSRRESGCDQTGRGGPPRVDGVEGAGVNGRGSGRPVSLSAIAGRYEEVKKQVGSELRARQLASRFGGEPLDRDGGGPGPGKQDARRIAAARLGAGVSHTTLEKVLWLRRVAFDMERRGSLRGEAMDALDAIDGGEPVSWFHGRVQTLVLVDDLEQAAAEAAAGSAAALVAARRLKLLRGRGAAGVTAAMRREARQALAAARRADEQVEAFVSRDPAGLAQLQAVLKRRRREDNARHLQAVRDRMTERLKQGGEAGPGGGANV